MRNEIIFYLNGEKHLVSGEKIYWPLSRYIRECAGKTGTKVVCAEGDCGACTVLISSHLNDEFYSINSCISPMFTNDAKHVVTIEGLSLLQEGSHAISEALAHGNGTQCGFCSPGFVMSLTDLFEHNKRVDEQMIKNYTTGNLCRCTGYVDIIKSALCVDALKYKSVKDFFLTPEHIAELNALAEESLCLNFNAKTVVIVTSLEELYSYCKKFPQAKLIASATDLGVLMNKGVSKEKEYIFIGKIASLNSLSVQDDYLNIGSNKTLTEVQKGLEEFYPEFSKFLDEFASPQIKNRATLVGNIANGSPIGDSLPFLIAIEAILVISSIRGTRELPIDKFYKAYKDFDLKSDEIIIGVRVPKPKDGAILKLYKVANRTHLDIATLSAAFYIKIGQSNLIEHLHIAYGGVAETVLRLKEIEKRYLGCSFTLETFEMIGKDISDSIKPLTDVRGSAEFRKLVARNLLSRLYYDLGGL